LRIGIADVDALVARGSAIDRHAAENTTSIYTGVSVFPMLPDLLSTDRTSLVEGGERLVVVIELEIAPDGVVRRHDVYRALAVNHAKLDYESVGAWLEGRGAEPGKVAADDALEAQLWLQDRAASLLKRHRERSGALDLDTVAVTPVAKDGVIESLQVTRKNRARDLIEDFMIAANGVVARYLAAAGRSAIRRVVREPRRWDRIVDLASSYGIRLPAEPDGKALSDFLAARRAADPLRFPDLSLGVVKLLGPGEYILDRPGPADDVGHFGLSAPDYTHATAPNRRYADLVTQRLVKAVIAGAPPPYADDELDAIARRCTDRENSAGKVERMTRKAAAALLLERRIGATFDAIVTGVKRDATYVRLLSPPAEGRVVRGEGGMDVGERVRVRLVRTDAERGHVDFEGV
jgi:exoribonuclease-2